MESNQNTSGLVWYNCTGPVEGILASATPVQVEFGSDIARQINQQVHVQYGHVQTIQPQQIIVAQQSVQSQSDNQTSSSNNLTSSTPSSPVTVLTYDHQNSVPKTVAKAVRVRPSGISRVECSECLKTFSCNANLRDHMRLHTNERPFKCTECGMTFAQRSNWRLHKRVHTGERPYMCGVCGKTFSRSSHLPGHMRVHTGEKPFQCHACEKTFGSAQALKNHIRTHTGERPFVCDHCNTPFTHSSSLSSHKKRCNGQRRKRGRPLGSGRKASKKKQLGRPRGRPKKKPKYNSRLKKKVHDDIENIIKQEHDSLSVNVEQIKSELTESTILNDTPIIQIAVMDGIVEAMEHNAVADGSQSNRESSSISSNTEIAILPDKAGSVIPECTAYSELPQHKDSQTIPQDINGKLSNAIERIEQQPNHNHQTKQNRHTSQLSKHHEEQQKQQHKELGREQLTKEELHEQDHHHSISPKVFAKDMVEVAASEAGIDSTQDLHQEAAVAMAALQHANVHTDAHSNIFTSESQQIHNHEWYNNSQV